jgi:hypothetical protein
VKQQKRLGWIDLWLILVPVVFFLVGLLGHYLNWTLIQPN